MSCLCFLLNTEPLNTEHSKRLLIAIPNRNCLTHLVKQSACKELKCLKSIGLNVNISTTLAHFRHFYQVTTPTLTLPRQGGGGFKGALLFPLPPVKGEGALKEQYYSPSPGGRGLGGGGEKWDFLYYQDIKEDISCKGNCKINQSSLIILTPDIYFIKIPLSFI